MVMEILAPAVFREAVRENYKQQTNLQTLVKHHNIEINRDRGALPAGLEEEFSDSFQVGKFARKIIGAYPAQYNATEVIITSSDEPFTTNSVGLQIEFVRTVGTFTMIDTVIAEVTDAQTVRPYDNPGAGGVTGTLYVYETQYLVNDSLFQMDVDTIQGDETITKNGGASQFNALLHLGKLLVVADGPGVTAARGIIETFTDGNNVEISVPAFETTITGDAQIYRIATPLETEEGYFTPENVGLFSHYPQYADFEREGADVFPRFTVRDGQIIARDANNVSFNDGTVLTVFGVTVPQIPTEPDDEILVPEQVLDDAMAIAAAVLRGERSLSSIGLDDKQLTR